MFKLPNGFFTTEQWVGHNEIDGPPFMAFWRPFAGPYAGHRGHRYALWVTQPQLDGQNLIVPTPTLVTTACLGLSKDSGGSSFAVTHGDSTWFVWPGSSAKQAPGVPQYVACYDHLDGQCVHAATARRYATLQRPAQQARHLHRQPRVPARRVRHPRYRHAVYTLPRPLLVRRRVECPGTGAQRRLRELRPHTHAERTPDLQLLRLRLTRRRRT